MDVSQAVLERLARIEKLERGGSTKGELIAEVRALVAEAEAWSRREGGDAGAKAVSDLRSALERDMIGR